MTKSDEGSKDVCQVGWKRITVDESDTQTRETRESFENPAGDPRYLLVKVQLERFQADSSLLILVNRIEDCIFRLFRD